MASACPARGMRERAEETILATNPSRIVFRAFRLAFAWKPILRILGWARFWLTTHSWQRCCSLPGGDRDWATRQLPSRRCS